MGRDELSSAVGRLTDLYTTNQPMQKWARSSIARLTWEKVYEVESSDCQNCIDITEDCILPVTVATPPSLRNLRYSLSKERQSGSNGTAYLVCKIYLIG